ncbi:MAG: NADH-quinone oxidoreductase subunit J [Gemmatimonadota bacterium]|nr:NADH-quinone oxidoreductase subunit J [Gemmatimonadota bacterium]
MTDAVFWLMAAIAVVTAWRVFRTDSMVRAAYWLMASFVAVAVILVLLDAEFLGLVLVLMMAGEMTIMAVFMVMFMMNPAGLNPMTMVHQHRTAIVAGAVSFLGLAFVGVFARFPASPPPPAAGVTAALGGELLGDSMLVFETAGVTLLATMIGALAIASRRGRFGSADEGSVEPAGPPEQPNAMPAAPAEDAASSGHAHSAHEHGGETS